MAKYTLMLRYRDSNGKWTRRQVAKSKSGRPIAQTVIVKAEDGTVSQLKVDGHRWSYEVRVENKGTHYEPAGSDVLEAENLRIRLHAKQNVKAEGAAVGLVVTDPTEKPKVSLEDTFQKYVEDCRKRNVLEAMEQAVLVSAEWISLTGIHYVFDVNRDTILTFDDKLRQLGRSERTIRNKRQRLQSMFRFSGVDPAVFPPKPIVDEELPEIYEDWQTDALLARADKFQHLPLSMGLKIGLRAGEIAHGEWTDIQWADQVYHVQAHGSWKIKDHEDRMIPIPDELFREFKQRRSERPKDILICPTRNGTPNRKLLQMLKRLAATAKVECGKCKNCVEKNKLGCSDYYLHKLRATWITKMLRGGIDPRTVMEYAGHEDLETTLRYARPAAASDRIGAVNAIVWEGSRLPIDVDDGA